MDVHDLVAARLADRGLPPDHELAPHPDLGSFRVFVPVEEFPRYCAAEFLDLIHVAVDGLLQYVVNHLEVPGEIRPFEASGEIDEDVEFGDEDNRPLT